MWIDFFQNDIDNLFESLFFRQISPIFPHPQGQALHFGRTNSFLTQLSDPAAGASTGENQLIVDKSNMDFRCPNSSSGASVWENHLEIEA